jgi:hypothetical protein
MRSRVVRIELLLGAPVIDGAGRRVGRIEEFKAVRKGDDVLIVEYVMGLAGLIERLSAWGIGRFIRRALGMRLPEPSVIPWNALDLTDPRRPRLLVEVEHLRRRHATPRPSRASGTR